MMHSIHALLGEPLRELSELQKFLQQSKDSFEQAASGMDTATSVAVMDTLEQAMERVAVLRDGIRELEQSADPAAVSESATAVEFCNVLIVEDDPISAMVLKHLLEKMNCRATIANGGMDALEKLSVEPFELVFMDCVMPDMDGFETTERIRTESRLTIPVVAVTASMNRDTRSNCLRAGMNDVLAKPVNVPILESTLDRWLGTKAQTGVERTQNLREHQKILGYPDEVLREALRQWFDLHAVWLTGLQQSIHSGDWEQALGHAYQLRVGLSMLGFEHLYTELRQLEEHVKKRRWTPARQQMEPLADQLGAVNQALQPRWAELEQSRNGGLCRNFRGSAPAALSGRLLLVDENPMIRAIAWALETDGFHVESFASSGRAMRWLEANGSDRVDCVLCSENVVGQEQLQDCGRFLEEDSSLAVVVIAHFPTKGLVNAAIKSGIFDVLAKPCEYGLLKATLARGVEQTRVRRQMRSTQHAALRIGSAQSRLLATQSGTRESVKTELFNLPKHEAGGDFWVHVQPTPNRHCFYMTDVSGHDIEAAFVSAYFHGMIRGSRHLGNLGMEEALQEFNRFLANEWNGKDKETGAHVVEKSIACCAADLDRDTGMLRFYLCGCCLPVVLLQDGLVRNAARRTGTPLGWFDECEIVQASWKSEAVRSFYVWSDGVDALACELGVNAMTVAHMLIRSRGSAAQPEWLQLGRDDLLVAHVSEAVTDRTRFEDPVFFAEYSGDQWVEIDTIQAQLGQSMRLLHSEIPEECLYNLQLCYRETMLNALCHGCGRQADTVARATLCIDREGSECTLQVWDDGDPVGGGTFDFDRHGNACHRGLSLVRSFSKEIRFHAESKCVEMKFSLNPPSSFESHESS